MEMDREGVAIFAKDEATAYECLQIAPLGGNRTAILFLLSDADYVTTVSLVFEVEDFEPTRARGILFMDDWLMSLSAAPSGELFALEATKSIWRYAGADWTQTRVSEESLRRVWAKDSGGPIVVGGEGHGYRLQGRSWQLIPPIAPIQYFDVHGEARHGIYACGDRGTLHRFTGSTWQPVELHRHDQFRGLDVAPDGTIRLAGDNGVCLRVADDEITEIESSGLTYFSVRSFKGRSYWGDEAGVYVEAGDDLDPFEETGIGSDLRTDGDYLYVAGTDTAWRFDGKTWKTLSLVYDAGFRLT
jgi:hypothetical protein